MGSVDVLKGIVLAYGDILGMDLQCEYIFVCCI